MSAKVLYQTKEYVSESGVGGVSTDSLQLTTIHLHTQTLVDVEIL